MTIVVLEAKGQTGAMDDVAKSRAIELVRLLKSARFEDEASADAALVELQALVVDAQVSDLIFWPDQHPLSSALHESDVMPELIVELALRYRPIEL